jgi:hypothetical protein
MSVSLGGAVSLGNLAMQLVYAFLLFLFWDLLFFFKADIFRWDFGGVPSPSSAFCFSLVLHGAAVF